MAPTVGGSSRILMLINNLGPAGAESQVLHLAEGLAEQGHRVTVACQRGVTVSIDSLLAAGVRVVKFEAVSRRAKLRMLPRLVALAREHDVVHCTMWDASLWGRLAALIARRPSVVAEHTPGRDREQSQNSGKPRAQWIARHNRVLDPFTYATVACARWQVPILTSEGVAERKIAYIPNGVPVDEIERRSRSGLTRADIGVPEGATVLMQIARFQPQKNQEATIDVVRRLREDLGDVHAVFVGAGPMLEEMRRSAQESGAGEWTHFLGRRGDVPALLRLADVSVLPSFAEAMPMAIIEALALGVPVVATDVGDVRDVLEATGGGLVIQPGDDAGYEEACRRILTDPDLRRSLSESASAGARDLFDAGRMVERYDELLRAAAGREPLPASA